MKKTAVTLLALGDIHIEREQPETIFQHVAKVLRSGDIVFANLEQMYSDKGHARPGHSVPGSPRNIPALLYAGINVASLANNHTLDWGPEALLDTMARLKEANIPYVGAGKNINEARQPIIVERNGTKIGFLAYSCTGPAGYEAEENKPGYAPVRIWTIYQQIDYQPGTPPRIVTIPYKDDLAAMVEDIKKLKANVDVVVVSVHWGQHMMPRVIPMYCFEVGRAAVDAGADLILGGHPHILKGVEVYKQKVIFYSLCNFALEDMPERVAAELKSGGARKTFMDHYNFVPDPECPSYPLPHEARATLIVKIGIEAGGIKRVSYIPCYINTRAEPEIMKRSDPKGQEVFNYLEDISKSERLSVHFSWVGDEVLIQP